MPELAQFLAASDAVLGHGLDSNREQLDIVTQAPGTSVKIVAGPGSGKTTVIVLRVLKSVYVDGVDPAKIVATTFTVKASKQLRSRILEWGERFRTIFLGDDGIPDAEKDAIRRINFGAIVTGTIDSIAENVLQDFRQPDENPPVIVDELVTRQLMYRAVFARGTDARTLIGMEYESNGLGQSSDLNTIDKIVTFLLDFHSRMRENLIQLDDLAGDMPESIGVLRIYDETLRDRYFKDFPQLEQDFLRFLESERSGDFADPLTMLMVDEYQDTNFLQERIYFALAKRIVGNGGSITVVGDDDQSIYRFRGSRVFLFANLEGRARKIGVDFVTKFLSINYRSTPSIVDFCNDYIGVDPRYQEIRIPNKPPIGVGRTDLENFPVFGIFRDSKEELADEICKLVRQYTIDGRYTFVAEDGREWTFVKSSGGSAGDITILSRSPKNHSSGGKERLPLMIRRKLEAGPEPIMVFNPRGTPLHSLDNVSVLCGILMLCFDSDGRIRKELKVSNPVKGVLEGWLADAKDFVATAKPVGQTTLSQYVESWQRGTPLNGSGEWDKDRVTVLDVIYTVLVWMPDFYNDAEGLVYLQAIADAFTQAVHVNTHESNIEFDEDHRPDSASVKAIYSTVLVPIASGQVEIDEDLLFSVNVEDRVNIMSIHQSKGLEFPITIVDVASDFSMNHARQRMFRFPEELDRTAKVEELLKEYTEEDFGERDQLDNMYDELIRDSFVSFSRAKDVLILVGLSKNVSPGIENVATGWSRDGNWAWNRLDNLVMLGGRHDDKNQDKLF